MPSFSSEMPSIIIISTPLESRSTRIQYLVLSNIKIPLKAANSPFATSMASPSPSVMIKHLSGLILTSEKLKDFGCV